MKQTKPLLKDRVCGIAVDRATAHQAERDGEKYYFCSEHCRAKFLVHPRRFQTEEKASKLL